MKRFERNNGVINKDTFKKIQSANILLIGCGGLGGFIANSLVRLGIKSLSIVDYDVYDESNLNRQLFSNLKTLNKSKVDVLKEELYKINPDVIVNAINTKYDKSFDQKYFNNIDFVFDGLDNVTGRLILEDDCTKYNIPLIHGAIAGWYGQFGIIMPSSMILHDIYKTNKPSEAVEKTLMSPTFIPPIVANLMISEFIKFVSNENSLTNKIFSIDILNHNYQIVYQKQYKKK